MIKVNKATISNQITHYTQNTCIFTCLFHVCVYTFYILLKSEYYTNTLLITLTALKKSNQVISVIRMYQQHTHLFIQSMFKLQMHFFYFYICHSQKPYPVTLITIHDDPLIQQMNSILSNQMKYPKRLNLNFFQTI